MLLAHSREAARKEAARISNFLLTVLARDGKNERGQGLTEYALILLLVVIVVILILRGTGSEINNTYSRINSTTVDLGH